MRSIVFALALPLVRALPQGRPSQLQSLARAVLGQSQAHQSSIDDDDNPSSPPQNNTGLGRRNYSTTVYRFPALDPQDPAQGLNFPPEPSLDQFKTFTLNLHNQVRPPYNISNSLGWDDEFASESYYWANTCVYKHGTTRQLSRNWGQNIVWDTWVDGALQMMARSFYLWFYSESRYYDFRTHQMFPEKKADELWQAAGGYSSYTPQVSHFQNILKRGFEGLGCAVKFCSVLQDEIAGQTLNSVFYSVCDFAQTLGFSSATDFPSFPTTNVPQLQDALNF